MPAPNESFNKEIRIARSALQRCAQLSFVLTDSLIRSRGSNEFAVDEIRTFSAMLREPIQLSNALINVPVLSIGEWNSWSTIVVERFYADPAFSKLVAYSEAGGGNFLPEKLKKLISDAPTSPRIRTELDSILPRFGKVLRLLDIVGEMLERDEPLKSALLIFARVSEQTQELVDYLNQRVSLHQEEPDEFTNVLDGASYTASIELKKVVQQELSGVTSIRPATTVYARTETAYALLSESFQQILAQFAKQIDPSIDIFDLFPNFRHKLEQSQVLRKEIYTISQIVRLAEKEPDGRNVEKLNNALIRFMEKTVRFLFYKDVETFERFVEEILGNKAKEGSRANRAPVRSVPRNAVRAGQYACRFGNTSVRNGEVNGYWDRRVASGFRNRTSKLAATPTSITKNVVMTTPRMVTVGSNSHCISITKRLTPYDIAVAKLVPMTPASRPSRPYSAIRIAASVPNLAPSVLRIAFS